ncbi:TonB-dependent hemoglobin/transferrin/lactoferrin family receptor [Luteimonas aquatica]|uniref:TonB-dependent hemoglobin/transferrin/lactoferrin family receptor n=1 Tax=Luteimonas aquatica TaxID=450364 RepID=UPI001F590B85|nr:TonB-dependent hemoglobin/transferrin/lactoferrin family receptor [Luteimonas aquatica]
MRLHPLSLALCLALPSIALAEEAPEPGQTAELTRVVVSATRTERVIADVPNTVDVIDRARMDETLTRDLKDLFRYEPGISVTSSFGRFGLGDIRVRGLGGNRVRIQTDGIPVSDAFSIGSFSNANRNFVDLDTLKRVEVVRGPTSSLYGSDALGGVVSFVTKDPSDYLGEGKDSYFGLKFGYESSWSGLFAGATAAARLSERWSAMVAVDHRQGKETENMGRVGGEGAARTRTDPQDRDGRSLLTKLVYEPSATQRFKLTVEGNEDSADTDLLSMRGRQASTGATNRLVTGDDHQTRARVSLAHEMDEVGAWFADSLDWQVYRQDSETTQDTMEVRRTSRGVNERRERQFNFDQRLYGVQANFHKEFETGGARHTLSYGLDVSRAETRQKRDGLVYNLDSGAVSNAMLPDVFPVRDFPISRTTNAALYVQDEIALADDRLRLIPAVRVDRYELKPRADAIFREDNPGLEIADLRKTSVSPKLGAVWHFAGQWSLFGGYSRGFRSPPYNDVNIGFTNRMFGYTAIPNPDLKPETSNGYEAGLRFVGPALSASLSTYYNTYRDFIDSTRFIGFNAEGLQVFQSQNIDDVRIYGVELKSSVDLAALSDAWSGWSLRGAVAWSRGKGRGAEAVEVAPGVIEDRTVTTHLASVDPLTATLGVAYDHADWGAELAGRFVGRKDRLPPVQSGAPAHYRQTPGYAVLDLLAHWDFTPGARFNVGVFNLADRRYFDAGDMPLVTPGSNVVDRFTSPGRNVSMSLALEW